MSQSMVQSEKPKAVWKQWYGSNGRLSLAHAMREVGAVQHKTACGATLPKGSELLEPQTTATKCDRCKKLLLLKANGGKKQVGNRVDPKTVYNPRFRFEDWDK